MKNRKLITLKVVEALQPGEKVWDTKVAGFFARRQKGDAASYCLFYRTKDGRDRWPTIGRHGSPWTPDTARSEAKRLLGEIVRGADPAEAKQAARKARSFAELCDDYLAAAKEGKVLKKSGEPKRASTLATDQGRIERHIKPILGRLKVAAITRADIERFNAAVSNGETAKRVKTGKHGLARVTGGKGTATRTLGLLGAILAFAVEKGLRPDNPARGVRRHKDGERTRRLSDEEYAVLGAVLRSMPETAWPVAIAAVKFLALTGWRRGEMLALEWADVDLATRTANLPDTKTGKSMRPLSRTACDVLRALPRLGALVFPASGSDKPMNGFHKIWLRVAEQASFGADVTPHVLRHSLASIAADLEFSELSIAALLGHKKHSTTSKYTHKADAVLLQAADAVANRISELLGDTQPSAVVVELPRRAAQ